MSILRRGLPALVVATLAAGACGGEPTATGTPSATTAPSAATAPLATDVPFAAAAWPRAGNACDIPGYQGLIGRIEATDATTVRFSLCRPDGAFRARLAHPALAILDTTAIERLASDRSSAEALSGTGPYRIARWVADDNVQLERVAASPSPAAVEPTIVLRWATDPAARAAAIEDATVDGIDAPGDAQLEQLATQPELAVTPRPGLATSYLAFGSGPAFAAAAVRRAFAASLDRDTLVADAFATGSVVPTHMTPCAIDGACVGQPWYEFNAPAAAAALDAAKFDRSRTYTLTIPDEPVPGLPDPAATAQAVSDQLGANLGLAIQVETMPADAFRTAADAGMIAGLYLDGITTSLADPTGILAPLFGGGVRSMPARRVPAVPALLEDAAATADPATRTDAITKVNDAIRSAAVVVPLANPGGAVAYRTDVTGVATSPLGLDPLGAATAGDRGQLVFMQGSAPDGAYCGDQASLDAIRLCGLVTQGLFGFDPGAMAPVPRLARRCDPNADATAWTCRLRPDQRYSDGLKVDAGDVLASFVAQWDRSQPLRASRPDAPFAAWDELFGGTLGGDGTPAAAPTAIPATPTPGPGGSSPAGSSVPGPSAPGPSASPAAP